MRIEMRRFKRLLDYKTKYCPDYEANWSREEGLKSDKYYIFFDHSLKAWRIGKTFDDEMIQVFLPKDIAAELCWKLNNGKVTL